MDPISRRVLLSGALASAAAQSQPEEVRLPKRIRLAILGFDGHPGEITGPLPRLPDIDVVAVHDADPKAMERAARNPRLSKAKQYTSYEQMLDSEKLDLVAVCNNNGERARAVLACTGRRLNVIAEKPLAATRKDFDAVRRSVLQNKVALGMLLPMRFDSPYIAMKKIVDEGLIGEVAQIGAQKSYKAGDRAAWFLKRDTYGSTILWIGIHMIDLMRWTSGRDLVETAGCSGHVAFPQLGEMDNVTASLFRLDNGGVGTLRMDYLRSPTAETHGDDRLRLAGTDGVLEYQESTGVTLMTGKRKPERLTALPPRQSVFIDYLQATYNGKPTMLPLRDIWRVNEITIAAHEAAEGSRFIKI
jgi:predicted dehydrogenase